MKARLFKRLPFVLSLLFLVILIAATTTPISTAVIPNSMAALGDSITQAYHSTDSSQSNPAYSWSTGTSTDVNSLYLRFLGSNAAIAGQNLNYSVSGARMAGLSEQASRLSPTIEYVTILIGANDVCTSSEASMTRVADFQSQFITAMKVIRSRAPGARVYVVSTPNVYNLWAVLKENSAARSHWSDFKICQSMLANPLSTKKADVSRRERVHARNAAFNTVLGNVCVSYAMSCTFDNNAVFKTAFQANEVSTIDYFHPSVAGQAKLAQTAWFASDFVP